MRISPLLYPGDVPSIPWGMVVMMVGRLACHGHDGMELRSTRPFHSVLTSRDLGHGKDVMPAVPDETPCRLFSR